MQIRVRCSCGACAEWALLEMQGSIEIRPSAQQHVQNLVIGSLCRASEDKYFFTVGYHELEGKRVQLKNPLLVLRKIKPTDLMDVESSPLETPKAQPAKLQGLDLEVIGIIRQKLLFKTRPKALISKPDTKAKKPSTSLGPVAA